MKVGIVILARTNSSRFPKKVLSDLNGVPVIEFLIERLRCCLCTQELFLATSNEPTDDQLASKCEKLGVGVYRGDLDNVLQRFYDAARTFDLDVVVRINGDCPLIDHRLVDFAVAQFKDKQVDYASTILEPSFPLGMHIEVIKTLALKRALELTLTASDEEHVTPSIYNNSHLFKLLSIACIDDFSSLRFTIDEPQDLIFHNMLLNNIEDVDFRLQDLISVAKKPSIYSFQPRIVKRQNLIGSNTGLNVVESVMVNSNLQIIF